MIVDGLTFLGDGLFGLHASVEGLLRRLEETAAERAIVCPLRPRGYELGPGNDEVAEAVEAHPDRLLGFARVDPNRRGEAAAEADRALGRLGLRGLFLHPWEEHFRVSAPFVDDVVAVAQAHGRPVIVAAGYPWLSEALQVAELAARFPDVRFVATNGIQINISGLGQTDAELALQRCPNLAMQTSGVYREDFIEGVVQRLGAERVLYASGSPYFDPRLEIRRVQWSHLPDADKDAVLGGNAAALLGL